MEDLSTLCNAAELFHSDSRILPCDISLNKWIGMVNSTPELQALVSRHFDHFASCEPVALPGHVCDGTGGFAGLVASRRTRYDLSGGPLSLEDLGFVLSAAAGVTGRITGPDGVMRSLRSAPSGGALYPVDTYALVRSVAGLPENATVFYDSGRHLVRVLPAGADFDLLARATRLPGQCAQLSACVVFVAVLQRSHFKYGDRSYRFALLEAGHMCQNLLLAAEALGLNAVPVGGFVDDAVNGLLLLDGVDEAALYLVMIGGRREAAAPAVGGKADQGGD